MIYTLLFAFNPDFSKLIILRKPKNHKNPLFRGKWTVPGGKLEVNETGLICAIREFQEETGIDCNPNNVHYILSFNCNCDPSEKEHEVIVYGTVLPEHRLKKGKGTIKEPIKLCSVLPKNSIWYLEAIKSLSIERIKQF